MKPMVVLALVAAGLSAFADDKGVIHADTETWVEFNIPHVSFECTSTAPGATKGGELGVGGGWAPWADQRSQQDGIGEALRKSLMFTGQLNGHRAPEFNQYIGSIESPVRRYAQCEDSNGYFDHQRCQPCQNVFSNTGYCEIEHIYSRDSVISYVDKSLQLGVMVPMQLGDRFALAIGPELSLVYIKEGRVTNQLQTKTETGVNIAARAEVDIGRNWGLAISTRRSVSGPKMDMTQFGGYIKFR